MSRRVVGYKVRLFGQYILRANLFWAGDYEGYCRDGWVLGGDEHEAKIFTFFSDASEAQRECPGAEIEEVTNIACEICGEVNS